MDDGIIARRKLYIMRHAERVDYTFGSWIPWSFDKKNNYTRKNLNMPASLPKRNPQDFVNDCPLTRMGLHQASLTGEGMKNWNVKFDHVFCSPSLRCMETCKNALTASGQCDLPINVEPGLFELLSLYAPNLPKWMSVEEFKSNGFNVASDYSPVIPMRKLNNTSETTDDMFMRNCMVAKTVMEKYSGDILFVAHAGTLDTCSRGLMGKPPRPRHEMEILVQKIPYASVVLVEQENDGNWVLKDPPFPPLRHSKNLNFDCNILTS